MTKSKKSRFLAVAGVLGFGLFGIQTGTSVAGMTGITPIKLSAENAKKAFYSDYGTEADCLANGVEVTKEIANEGMVLLKNDGTLPLDGVKNITIFGKNSVKPCIGGGGSGGSKGVMDTIDVYESLTDAGYNCNPKMKAFYEDATRSGTGRHTGGGFGAPIDVGETRLSSYDSATKATFAGYSDAAVIFITRTGAEGADEPLYEVVDDSQGSEGFAKDVTGTENYPKDAHYLELSHNEKDMINLVETSGFKKIILVANSCNAMELDSLVKDTKINGIIWTNGPGGTGFSALGKIMNGEVNPSGKTVDAFAKDFTKDPAFQNISTNAQTQADHKENYTLAPADTATDAQKKMFEGATINKFTEYEEGIYIGYKYYETKGEVEGEEWYNDNVVFPFGYGLSYTSFSKNISAIRIDGVSNTNSSIAITSASKKVEIDVTVKNTGEVAGKEVVQIYGNPEYIEGGIEKASANLLAFGKSKLLAPGESETVTVSYNVQDMGSYDYNDANKNGHMGYELEGTTVVTLKDDSHKVAVGEHNTINFTTASVIDYDTDGNTSNKVVNQFSAKVSKPDGTASTIDNPYRSLPIESDGLDFTSMTRKAVGGERMILPSAPAGVATTIGTNSVLAVKLSQTATDFSCQYMTAENSEGTADVSGYLTVEHAAGTVLANQRMTKETIKTKLGTTYTQRAEGSEYADTTLFGKIDGATSVDDASIEAAVNNMSYHEMVDNLNSFGWKNGGAPSIGKPQGIDIDGPSAVYKVDYPVATTLAATFNVELARKMGESLGNECLWAGISGWYGPAMDTHRSPFSGRNFEYYSEDGLLGGKIAAAQVSGAKTKGVFAYMKHMALNDQETQRSGNKTFVSEQALREIYLKPFRLCVEEGGCQGVMGGMNAIGFIANYDNYAEMTNVLRGEWGFDGYVETDAGSFSYTSPYSNGLMARIAGCGNLLGFGSLNEAQMSQYFGVWDADKKVPTITKEDNTVVELWNIYYYVRLAMKQELFITGNSNMQENHLDFADWKLTDVTVGAGMNFSQDVTVDTSKVGTTDVNYTCDNLPAGVTLSTNGTLSGSIATKGTYNLNIVAHADGWVTSTTTQTITITDVFAISNTAGTVGTAFTSKASSETVVPSASGNTTVTVSYAAEGLPEGLVMDDEGAITGTPTTAGTYNCQLIVTQITVTSGSSGSTTSKQFKQDFQIVIAADASAVDPVDKAQADAEAAQAEAEAAKSDAAAANTAAAEAAKAAASASTLGTVGMVVGIIGIVAACGALVLTLLKKKN